MSVRYHVTENPLRPGTFYPRPVVVDTLKLDDLCRRIERCSSLSKCDVHAVVSALCDQIVAVLADGSAVKIDGLIHLTPRMSQQMQRASDSFDPAAGGKLSISGKIHPRLVRALCGEATFEKVHRSPRTPRLISITDENTQQFACYTPGRMATIRGDHLKIQDMTDPTQGIFFESCTDGTVQRADCIGHNGNRRLVFDVPNDLAGPQNIRVATRYTPHGDIREDTLREIRPARASGLRPDGSGLRRDK